MSKELQAGYKLHAFFSKHCPRKSASANPYRWGQRYGRYSGEYSLCSVRHFVRLISRCALRHPVTLHPAPLPRTTATASGVQNVPNHKRTPRPAHRVPNAYRPHKFQPPYPQRLDQNYRPQAKLLRIRTTVPRPSFQTKLRQRRALKAIPTRTPAVHPPRVTTPSLMHP